MDVIKRLSEINVEITKLEKEKANLESIKNLSDKEQEINDFLINSYNGKQLSSKYSMSDFGLWSIKGEDPNCDFGGVHHQPDLGVFEGTLKEALYYAFDLPNFFTWGSGGDINKISVVKPQTKNINK